jgi:hypothetical protein
MSDPFEGNASGLTSPAEKHYTVTPANEDLPIRPRALVAIAAGDAVIRDVDGTEVTYPVDVGDILPIRAAQVRTGTTATLVAWY